MADTALARREARRKRILENSQNRLQLISNITNDECCKESPAKSVRTSTAAQNSEIKATTIENSPIRDIMNNGISSNEPISFNIVSDNNSEVTFFDEREITNDSAAFAFPNLETSETSFFEKLTTYKYDLVLLSLLIQLLHTVSLMEFDNAFFFLPLVLYTTTKLIFFPKQENSKYGNILMLLNGMTSQHTLKIMSFLHWVSIAVQDACIYLFTTICMQSLLITINSFI